MRVREPEPPTDPRAPRSCPPRSGDEDDARGVSLWRGAFRRLRRNPTAIVGAVIVLLFVLVAIVAPLLTPYAARLDRRTPARSPRPRCPGPSDEHWLGLDRYGRDMCTQLVCRRPPVPALRRRLHRDRPHRRGLLGVVAGGFGALGGRVGGWVDSAVMRVVDMLLAVPSLLLAVSIAAVLGQNAYAVMIAIGVAQVPIFARLLRGSMLSQGKPTTSWPPPRSASASGKIVSGHIVPNSVGPTIVQATLNLATAIIEVAALSFLGLGDSDPAVAEWGRMLVAAQDRFEAAARLALLPGFAIAFTALGFTLLGEAMREALDPRSRR